MRKSTPRRALSKGDQIPKVIATMADARKLGNGVDTLFWMRADDELKLCLAYHEANGQPNNTISTPEYEVFVDRLYTRFNKIALLDEAPALLKAPLRNCLFDHAVLKSLAANAAAEALQKAGISVYFEHG